MMPARILVVNSPASDYLLIKSLLSDYSVLSAYGKAETLRQLDMCGDIDLLILDMSSDDKDGCEILNAINPNPRYNHLRSIVITNFDDGEAETTVYALSAADYLCKPIHRESFKSCIKMNLELTHQERFKHELNELKVLFDAIFQRVPVGIAICYNDNSHAGSTETISINPMLEKITGRTRDEIMKLGWQAITHPDDLEKDLSYFRRLQSGEIESYSMEKRYLRPDGSSVWVHMVVASLSLPNMSKNNHICIVQDISERKEIERALSESERSKSVLLSHLPGLAYRCLYDREWTMLYVSSGCYELTGYRPESLLYNTELSYNDLITPEYREPLYNEWERILSARLPFKYEYQITTATGERKWVLEMGQGIYDEEGNVEALEGIVLDISDRKKMEDNLRYQYEHDRWTGLYNRSYLENLLISEAKTPKAGKRAVISINLSAVQSLTTTYGFHYTQDLIKSISDALFIHCTDKRMLFNTYENRFVFYVRDYKVRAELTNFCESIIKTLNPMLTAERVGAGLGIIEIDDYRQLEVDELLRNLLIASEKALSMFNGEIGYLFFDESMEAQIMRENEIKRTLTHIAESDDDCGLFLQYQPILDLKTNRICGFEALARLRSDKLDLVPPLEFIPIAEKTKLIIPIGRKIIRQALEFQHKLEENGMDTIIISINVSAIQLTGNNFCQSLFETIRETKAEPRNICLEITESVFASSHEELNEVLGQLVESGIHIAIDDFGTGYSSLARERELNINCLKIDKSFIDKLMYLNPDKAITSDIISMAHKLGHSAIAEGVEHETQLHCLQKFGCDKIQGYLISRPLNEDSALKFLEEKRWCSDIYIITDAMAE